MKTPITMRFDSELLAKIDRRTGNRTQWIEQACRDRLGNDGLDKPKVPTRTRFSPRAQTPKEPAPSCQHPVNRRIGPMCAACGKDLR